jgi:hypothetical protein
MNAEPEPYLTASQVAERIGGMTPHTIGEWARSGVLRGYRPGGKVWLFLWSEVAEDIARSLHKLPGQVEQKRRERAPVIPTKAPSPDDWPPLREVFRQGSAAPSAAGRARSAGKKKAAVSSH